MSANLTIRQLEVFAMASRSPTFSEAAKRLGISQPSLSSTVAKIEDQLGLRLFDRTTRTMVLTSQGERLAVVADELVRNFRASLKNIQDVANVSRGRLSMAVIPSVAASIGPRVLKEFFASYPEFDVALHDVTGEKALAWVLDRVVDFAVIATPASHSELHVEPVYDDDFQIICHKDSPLASKRSVTWNDLASVPIVLTGGGAIRRDIENAWLQAKVAIQPRFEIEQIMTGLALVSADLGVAILPGMCRPAASDDLVAVPMRSSVRIQRSLAIVRRSDRSLTKPVQHMFDCFQRAFEAF
ncbi:MAG: LysR family transcriptional regulator [Pseudomonadota bacterium]